MKVLVTGGSGFLGQEICRQLVTRGTTTSSLSRHPSLAMESLGVRQHQGDIADPAAVFRALADCDAVVHSAALAGVSGPLAPYWNTNVLGTRNIIDQCRAHGVGALVYTSTASVVFGPGGLENADEGRPYPHRHLAAYPRTKAHAEALVLAANSPDLATVSLRPHIIWGPGDPHFVPALVRAVRAGRLMMPGNGTNLIDTTHLRTAAHAHLLALDRLQQGCPIGGRAFFITQDDPRPLRDITAHFLRAAGQQATWCTVPPPLAYAAAVACETVLQLTGYTRTHALSRFLVAELVHPHWFSIEAARRDLQFAPPITFDAGITALSDTAPR